MKFKSMIVATVATMTLAMPAAGATGNARDGLQAMKELNLIVLGDLHGGHEVEGKTFVGGNLSGNDENFGIGNSHQGASGPVDPTRAWATLTVVGNVTSSGVSILNGSNGTSGTVAARKSITIGGSRAAGNFNIDGSLVTIGSNTPAFNLNSGTDATIGGSAAAFQNAKPTVDPTLLPGGTNDLAAKLTVQRDQLAADLGALATSLGNLTVVNASTINTSDHNNVVFNAVDGGQGFALFNIGQSFFDFATSFSFSNTSALPIIINVTGATSYTINSNSNNTAFNQDIIWNFLDATNIVFNKQFNGSILAPQATISNSTPLEGSVVARIFNQGGEVHLGTYRHDYPREESSPTPEPAIWLQLITGFGVVGSLMRRRRPVAA